MTDAFEGIRTFIGAHNDDAMLLLIECENYATVLLTGLMAKRAEAG